MASSVEVRRHCLHILVRLSGVPKRGWATAMNIYYVMYFDIEPSLDKHRPNLRGRLRRMCVCVCMCAYDAVCGPRRHHGRRIPPKYVSSSTRAPCIIQECFSRRQLQTRPARLRGRSRRHVIGHPFNVAPLPHAAVAVIDAWRSTTSFPRVCP